MDEETAIIDSNTRNERIKNFFISNRKSIFITLIIIIGFLIGYFTYIEYRENQRLKISDQYNFIVTEYKDDKKEKTANLLVDLIYKNDPTYSPLSLYFIIDNKLITQKSKINSLFDNIIKKVKLDKEIQNLVIYKKALYNADNSDENELLEILKPIINSDSIWKSQAWDFHMLSEFIIGFNISSNSFSSLLSAL